MLDTVRHIAVEAGAEILSHYAGEVAVESKADGSPLTQADRAAHRLIVDRLRTLYPEIPVLSEESDPTDVVGRRQWTRFWIVDPLDGTKEFVKKTGQFTVNIALIEDGVPTLGVVHIPVQAVSYVARRGLGAFRHREGDSPVPIFVRRSDPKQVTVVASRDHAGPEVEAIIGRMKAAGLDVEVASMGSSIKFCLVAEGSADLYPRTGPTMEWDTAAAQCVVEAAGGAVTTLGGERLRYNKESLRTPSFVVIGDPSVDWAPYLSN